MTMAPPHNPTTTPQFTPAPPHHQSTSPHHQRPPTKIREMGDYLNASRERVKKLQATQRTTSDEVLKLQAELGRSKDTVAPSYKNILNLTSKVNDLAAEVTRLSNVKLAAGSNLVVTSLSRSRVKKTEIEVIDLDGDTDILIKEASVTRKGLYSPGF